MLLQPGAWLDDGTATHPLAGRSIYNITMGKSKQGGVFGYLRGKVGSVSYSVLSGNKTSSGKKEQIVRALPESVSNPQTMGQAIQRMKLAPAQKFYAAFAALLSNAFEGVQYGEASRRYFLSKAMTEEGPYVQRGVDRFLPAKYLFSEGTLPAVGIEQFSGGTSVITLSATTTVEAAEITPAIFAAALNVSADTQITIVVVNNVNGVFTPSYIGYDERLKIEDLPTNIFGKDENNHITLNPAALNLDASAIVACCVVLSKQDASGNWLRSTQKMVISAELEQSLYSADALAQATASYQSNSTANAINSEWYYNLGMNQAFNGKVMTMGIRAIDVHDTGLQQMLLVVCGVQQIDGVIIKTLFTTDGTASGQLVGSDAAYAELMTDNGTPVTPEIYVENYQSYQYARYQSVYAQQAGLIDRTNTAPVQEPFLLLVAHYDSTEEDFVHTEEEFVRIEHATPDDVSTPLVAVTAEGTKRYIISGNTTGRSFAMPLKAKSAVDGERAWGTTPSYSTSEHKLSNDDTQFICITYTVDSDLTGEEDVENWNTLKGMGFSDTIWLYQ